MKNTTILFIIIAIILLVGGFVFVNGKNGTTANVVANNEPILQGETQQVIIGEKNLNYYPNEIKVKAGKPVSITLDSSVTGCLRSFTIKDLGVSKNAKTPSDTIDFTPTKKGTYGFACIMGMGRGNIVVE